jgi:hypothetical protein
LCAWWLPAWRVRARSVRGRRAFPAFLALDVSEAAGSGCFSARYAPFKYVPAAAGVPDTRHREGEGTLAVRLQALAELEGRLRSLGSPLGDAGPDLAEFYNAATKMMHNPIVDNAFRVGAEDSARAMDPHALATPVWWRSRRWLRARARGRS